MKSLVSIIILNWNGKVLLEKCLQSLCRLSYKPVEIIVVDNNSSDGSLKMVRKKFPHVRLIGNKTNLGYSGGNNIGMRKSKGAYICILNNDTEVPKNFLEPLVWRMETDAMIGCVQPKILYAEDHSIFNAVGSYFTSTGFLYHYGYRKKDGPKKYNTCMPIFSAKGAAMLLRKKALDRVGLLDEDFIIYFEETDLCHRLWLAGYSVLYEPKSRIYHYVAVDTSKQMGNFKITYLSFRNRINSYIKNLEYINLIKILGILLPMYIFLFFAYLVKLQVNLSLAIVASMVWNIYELPKTFAKRSVIQSRRMVSDAEIFRKVKKDPPFIYYYYMSSYNVNKFID